MAKAMKKAGMKISVCMGLVMSFFLSLTGNLTSGHFTMPRFLLSFLISTIISLVIGFLVPMARINAGIEKRMGAAPGDIRARLLESLVSDLIYTPVITLAMVSLAYFTAMRQSGGMAQLSFLPMFLKSLGICFVVGYILIFVFMPVFVKMFVQKKPLDR